MKGNYEPDTFTENDVIAALQRAGLRFKAGKRYILSQCPTHEDRNPSVQIYKDDWFVNCHSGCGRYHITKAFPELRKHSERMAGNEQHKNRCSYRRAEAIPPVKYKTFDLMEKWQGMPVIPRDHQFKTIPLVVLDDLGWRWDEAKNSYFIPYFSGSRRAIPFAQWRHLSGERRFTFLKDAKPTCYGTWNLEPGEKIFIVEGTSDCAVLELCGIPWIGMPSSASGELMKTLAVWCGQNNVQLVYAGDNDDAGDKLREALESVSAYRVCQPPERYKDWGDFLVGTDIDTVTEYCMDELYPERRQNMSDVDKVKEVFPGAVELEIENSPKSKELSGELTLF